MCEQLYLVQLGFDIINSMNCDKKRCFSVQFINWIHQQCICNSILFKKAILNFQVRSYVTHLALDFDKTMVFLFVLTEGGAEIIAIGCWVGRGLGGEETGKGKGGSRKNRKDRRLRQADVGICALRSIVGVAISNCIWEFKRCC